MPDTVTLIDPDGVARDVPADVAQGALSQGWRQQGPADVAQASTEAANTADYGGAHGAIGAIGAGAVRGATLGVSDLAARAFGGSEAAEKLRGLRAENPALSMASEFAGTLAPAFITGGAATPAGMASGLGRSIIEHSVGEGAGLAARVGAGTAAAAAEGSLYGGGEYLSQVALEDKPLSAEGFVGAMGKGALFAAPVGGAFTLGGEALLRARSLFPRSEVTAQAARSIDKDATSALTQSMADGEQMAQVAQRKLSEVDAQVGLAQSGETVTRRMFGAADQQALGDQVAGAVDRTQIAKALEDYQASKTQLADWIAAEGDPELEAAMRGLQAPRDLRPTPGSVHVPGSEFGSGGGRRGLDTVPYGTSEIKIPISSTIDETGSLKRPGEIAEGTPAPGAQSPLSHDLTSAYDISKTPIRFDPETRSYHDVSSTNGEPDLGALLGASKTAPDQGIPMRARVAGRYEAAPVPEASGVEPGQPYHPISDEDYLAHRKAFESKITPEEHKAVDAYTGSLYKDVNRALRHGEIRNGREGFISQLDNAVAKSPLHENATLYRGLSGTEADQFRKLEIGDSFEEKAFTSTSSSPEAFKRDVNLHIDVPAGYETAPVPSSIDEKEWLLRRNTRFVVTGIKDEGASRTVSVRVVDSPRQPVEGMVSTKTGRQPDAPPLRVVKSTNGTIPGQVSGGAASADSAPRQVAPEAEFRKMQRAFRTRLTDDEIDQSLRYSREHYDDVNRHLRGHEKAHDVAEAKKIIPALDSMLDKARITEPIVVHRGASMRRVGDLKPGDEYIDPGYQSTAWRPDNVKTFGEAHLVITAPVGTKIAPIASSKGEGEFLIARNTKLRITGREEHPGGGVTLHATVEVPAADRAAAKSSPFEPPAARPIEAMSKRELEYAQNDAAEHRRSLQYSGQHESPEFQESSERYNAISKRLDDIKSGASAEPLPPASDLMSQLKGTSAKIGEGSALAEISASSPARGEYVAKRAAKQVEDAAYFRKRAMDLKSGATPDADSFFAELTRPKTWHDYLAKNIQKAMHEEGSHAAAMERLKGEWATMQGEGGALAPAGKGPGIAREPVAAPAAPEPAVRSGHLRTLDDLHKVLGIDPALESHLSGQRTVVDSAMRERMGRVSDDEAIGRLLGARPGKDVNVGPGIARAAKVIGDHEAALANLADVVGADAPQTVVENAKAYRAAIREQHELSAASSAKAAADIKSKVQPALDATVVDDKVMQALRQHDAQVAAKAAKSPAADVAPPAAASGIGSKLTTAGAALEVLHALGAHVPSVASIPVIGPILSLFLKAKAVMGIIGRKGGSVSRSAEGLIAAKSAVTRDRINAAVVHLLEGGAKGARKASAVAVPTAAMLGYKLFPGGEDPKGKDLQSLYHARMDEIARAQAPGAIDAAIGDRIQTGDPALHDAIVAQQQKAISFLDSKAPKQTLMPGVLPGDGTWKPSRAALEEWGKYVQAVNDPASVLEDLAHGHATLEGAETLQAVYPKLLAVAQQVLLARAPQMQATLPYARRVAISIMFGVPVDTTMTASHMTFLQPPPTSASMGHSVPATPTPGGPAIVGPLQIGQHTMPALDRRAGA